MKTVRRLIVSLTIILLFSLSVNADNLNNPVADPAAVVVSGDMRFTVLTPEMIRIEWRSGSDKSFEDHATFAIINRRLPVPEYNVTEDETFLYIETQKLKLKYRKGAFPGTFNPASSQNLQITFDMDGKTVKWYPWKKDALNLKGTCRTLDSSNGDNKRGELESGLISRSGWAVIDDTETRSDGSKSLLFVENEETGFDWVGERADKAGMDWYFMCYGHDYKKALYDFTRIAGKIPMPPLYAFGYWYSKYQKYNEQDFKDLVNEMHDNDVPLDVMVVDTDWHINGWTGWSWNRDLFPDPKEFLSWLHDKDLKVTLNLHPAYGVNSNEDNFSQFAKDLGVSENTENIAWNLENPKFYKSLFNNILRPHEKIGVDFWWLDWQQWLVSDKVEGLGHTYWLNYVFFEDMQRTYPEKRAMIFHRWGGLGNHRYQIGFSGDSHSNFPTLAFQPYFTATASNVGYGYWGHDLGGHVQSGPNNPELYLRWIQFGVFSPLLRTHSTNADNIERRIWKYPNFNLMKEAFELRYALVPYIYTYARKAYDSGVSLCRPLYYDYPECNEAYNYENEYMFGDEILVSPVVKAADKATGIAEQKIWIPKGTWYEACSGDRLEGDNAYTRQFGQADIPYYYRAGAVIPNYPKMSNLKHRPDNLIVKFIPGSDGEFNFYEDENDTESYKNGAYTYTRITQAHNDSESVYTIYPTEGQFSGMPEKRSYTVELMYSAKPGYVKVNGKQYEENSVWSYDNNSKTVRIQIPLTSCKATTVISVPAGNAAVADVLSIDNVKFNYNRNSQLLSVNMKFPANDSTLQVFDTHGNMICNDNIANRHEAAESTSEWAKGVYVCKITHNKETQVYKFIK